MKLYTKINPEQFATLASKLLVTKLAKRKQIIELLLQNGKMNVTQIFNKINLIQAETSHHLMMLHECGVLNRVREGKSVMYSVNEENLEKILKLSEKLKKEIKSV